MILSQGKRKWTNQTLQDYSRNEGGRREVAVEADWLMQGWCGQMEKTGMKKS